MPQIDLGKIVGDQGPQGPRGLQGNPGEKGETGSPGPGVAAGGAMNQVLVKHSGMNFDTKWVDAGSLPVFAGVQYGLAIVANGDTHPAIDDGQFVYVRNHSTLAEGLYKATAAIGTDVALTTSNLTADSAGGLNDLQAQVTKLNGKIASTEETIADGLAIIANGDTHAAVTAGQAVYVRSHSTLAAGLYWASSAIETNAALSTSNLTADAAGGLNKLKADLDSLNSKIASTEATLADGLAIIANGNTHAAVAAGQAVYVRSHSTLAAGLYWASSAIGTNAALSTSNLTADAEGGLNKLKADLDSLKNNYENMFIRKINTYTNITIPSNGYIKVDSFSEMGVSTNLYLIGMNVRGWSGSINGVTLGKGTSGTDFYLSGEANKTISSITVEYIFSRY